MALRQNGVVSCHYVDSVGFADVPAFLTENYLKNAEMALEDKDSRDDGRKQFTMMNFTNDEMNLKCIYSAGGNRT